MLDRLRSRLSAVPSERDWERSELLEPRPASYRPELVSDGGGLAFPPSALTGPAARLDPEDPAVAALIDQLTGAKAVSDAPGTARLDGWRVLARAEGEILFGRGVPPALVTIAMRREGRRDRWSTVAVTRDRLLRTTRDGIRASGWRLDPTHDLGPEDTVLRVLVTEQTRAGGKRADGRLLAPDLHDGDDELVLTMFVTPRPGYQPPSSSHPETPARVVLPTPIGRRTLVDGALLDDNALRDGG